MKDPRTIVRDYLTTIGWSLPQFLRAVRMGNTSDVVSEHSMRNWLAGDNISTHAKNSMLRFASDWPNPGSFAEWEHSLAVKGRARAFAEQDALQARRDAVIRAHEERRAALLAAERAPRVPASPWFPSRRMISVSTSPSRNNLGQAGRESGMSEGRF